eukprot:662322-Pleurochrysis_carterae.AAC.1
MAPSESAACVNLRLPLIAVPSMPKDKYQSACDRSISMALSRSISDAAAARSERSQMVPSSLSDRPCCST